jgi:hypothetical protein
MNIYKILILLFLLSFGLSAFAQISNFEKDSIYIEQVELHSDQPKVLHAEPLFIDLIRDLGARKGEKEWNVGLGLTDRLRFDSYDALIEYEWAPVNRLGLEVELPFSIYSNYNGQSRDSIPPNRLKSLKLAAQWSFFINETYATSMALGYINEFELSDFSNFGNPLIKGNIYNPFIVVAKRWGNNFHTLLYTGPQIEQVFKTKEVFVNYNINTNFHYMISGTRNFIGIEFNKSTSKNGFDMTIRPQMRLGIADNLLVGIVPGIPISRANERISSFVRLIWEPGHRV